MLRIVKTAPDQLRITTSSQDTSFDEITTVGQPTPSSRPPPSLDAKDVDIPKSPRVPSVEPVEREDN